MGILSDAASSATGNIESAYIIIKDYRKAGNEGEKAAVNAIIANTRKVLQEGGDSLAASIQEATNKIFKVQFNPKELQLNAKSTQLNYSDTQIQQDNQLNISDSNEKPSVELTLNLIFDQVNVFDAFMWDKIRNLTTANGIASAGASLGKVWTVQTEVEGFLAAIRNQYTRNVTFQWGEFAFVGQLVNITAQYTMFSADGRPIRANTTLHMRQEMDEDLLETGWYQYFDEAFTGDSSNLVKPEQYIQSLINLGL